MSHMNAQIVRLYDTVFDRAPDAKGLEFWNGATHQGLGLRDLANFFIAAPEFAATYGEPTTRGFVEAMYRNVLDRPGEAEGIAFWTNALDQGLADRPQVVVGFSESAEHVQQMEKGKAIKGPPAPLPDPEPAPPFIDAPKGERDIRPDLTFLPETRPGDYPTNGQKVQYAPHDGATLVGGEGWDQLNALPYRDVKLWGQNGDDHLEGYVGNDELHGGPGNDTLSGHEGNDILFGGPAHDVMSGGPGDDVFVIRMLNEYERDVISDFQPGDKVRFIGSEPVGPYAISTRPGGELIFDLNMAKEHLHLVHFRGLTQADEGWVREAFIFG